MAVLGSFGNLQERVFFYSFAMFLTTGAMLAFWGKLIELDDSQTLIGRVFQELQSRITTSPQRQLYRLQTLPCV